MINANCASLFAMELEKLLVDGKIRSFASNKVSPKGLNPTTLFFTGFFSLLGDLVILLR